MIKNSLCYDIPRTDAFSRAVIYSFFRICRELDQELDKAVDLCYRPRSFINETKRIEFLFEFYDKLTS